MDSDDELQRKIGILQEAVKLGKINIASSVYQRVTRSLSNVRLDSNGKVDLSTVDPIVRDMANVVSKYHDKREKKNAISLNEIQRTYFGFIESNFSSHYKAMVESQKDPNFMAEFFSEHEARRNEILKDIPEFLDYVMSLWNSCASVAWDHLEDMHCLKLSHAGDLFPSYSHNVASKCGIYSDTIVLPCPFVRSLGIGKLWNDRQKVYYFIKHALSVLAYKDLALSELKNPIVVILPDPSVFEEHEMEFLTTLAVADSVKFTGNIFGREFNSMDEVSEFFSTLDDKHKVLSEIKDESKLLTDIELGTNIEVQLDELLGMAELAEQGVGEMLLTNFVGRMCQANDALLKSRRIKAIPLIDAPTSWKYFNWKLQLDSFQLDHDEAKNLHCSHALTTLEGTDLSWLGNIPTSALIEIRQQGALEEIRNIMSKNIGTLIESSPNEFGKTTYQVYKNFQDAFLAHNHKLKELRNKKWRFGGIEIGSMVCTGVMEVAAAATGTPLFGVSAWLANQFLDIPKIRDIPQKYRDLAEEDKQLSNSPVGLLVKCK